MARRGLVEERKGIGFSNDQIKLRLRFARASESPPLTDKLVFRFSHVKIRLLQPQISLAALFVMGLFRQCGARGSLASEAFGGPHRSASESSVGALQHY